MASQPRAMLDSTAAFHSCKWQELMQTLDADGYLFIRKVVPQSVALQVKCLSALRARRIKLASSVGKATAPA